MTAVSHTCKVVYYPVPKNACTTIKKWLYHMDTGRRFVRSKTPQGWIDIHNIYPSHENGGMWQPLFEHYYTFIILRDPIARFVSGFTNRVIFHGCLREASDAVTDAGLPVDPDIDYFATNIDRYRQASVEVNHHFSPQRKFVGNVVHCVSAVGTMNNLDAIRRDASAYSGKNIAFGHEQKGGTGLDVGPLSPASLKFLRRYYEMDFDLLADFAS